VVLSFEKRNQYSWPRCYSGITIHAVRAISARYGSSLCSRITPVNGMVVWKYIQPYSYKRPYAVPRSLFLSNCSRFFTPQKGTEMSDKSSGIKHHNPEQLSFAHRNDPLEGVVSLSVLDIHKVAEQLRGKGAYVSIAYCDLFAGKFNGSHRGYYCRSS